MSLFFKTAAKTAIASAILLFASLTNAATTVDISTDAANNGAWTFSDGTNSLNSSVSFGPSSSYWVTGNSYSLSQSINQASYTGWAVGNLNFNVSNLDSSGTVTINVASFGVDDRAALEINGHLIDLTGITQGRGTQGVFQFTSRGAYIAETFNGTGTDPANTNGIFTVSAADLHNGINDVAVIINNTNNGIIGNTIVNRGGDTASYSLAASLSYATAAVPEPETISLFIVGLLGLTLVRKTR